MTWDYLGRYEQEPIPEEWVWERLRLRRDGLLRGSDHRMVPDGPWDRVAWAAYRQALRDLPSNTTDPRLTVWPVAP
jgi:hypothetical protein